MAGLRNFALSFNRKIFMTANFGKTEDRLGGALARLDAFNLQNRERTGVPGAAAALGWW